MSFFYKSWLDAGGELEFSDEVCSLWEEPEEFTKLVESYTSAAAMVRFTSLRNVRPKPIA